MTGKYMNRKFRVGVIGATGMVGQRFVCLLENHPWFQVTCLCASARSAFQRYEDAVGSRWAMEQEMPAYAKDMIVLDAANVEEIGRQVDFVFCAVSMDKASTRELEETYARHEIPVVSNNSACRGVKDVPMIIPEINADHTRVIEAQRKRLGSNHGFIAVKPNCSIQSYVPALTPLMQYGIEKIHVCTYQAISGAGKTFETWPEMVGNVIPFIGGEEEKSEKEPLKVWGCVSKDGTEIIPAASPAISAQCLRVPVQDGHMAAVSVKFANKPSKEDILKAWQENGTIAQELSLPSAPTPFLRYMDEDNRPQSLLDRDFEHGMGVSIGRLREDPLFDYKFVCLSHNTLRGAAGGGVLSAELLCAQGYITRREEN